MTRAGGGGGSKGRERESGWGGEGGASWSITGLSNKCVFISMDHFAGVPSGSVASGLSYIGP